MFFMVLNPKATAKWLIENTSLSCEQISLYCGIHILEVEAIADGESDIVSISPIMTNQLTQAEIDRCQKDPNENLISCIDPATERGIKRKKIRQYTPLNQRRQIANCILYLVKTYPELSDGQIHKLISTTKNTVQKIRNGEYRGYKDLTPKDPIMLGLCTSVYLEHELSISMDRIKKEEASSAQ